jgi:hypothetical protein
VGSSLNQRTAEFSLCNTLVLLLDLAFKQFGSLENSAAVFAQFMPLPMWGLQVSVRAIPFFRRLWKCVAVDA